MAGLYNRKPPPNIWRRYIYIYIQYPIYKHGGSVYTIGIISPNPLGPSKGFQGMGLDQEDMRVQEHWNFCLPFLFFSLFKLVAGNKPP